MRSFYKLRDFAIPDRMRGINPPILWSEFLIFDSTQPYEKKKNSSWIKLEDPENDRLLELNSYQELHMYFEEYKPTETELTLYG